MRKWIGAVLLALGAGIAAASGCGNPEIATHQNPLSLQDASAGSAGAGGTGFHPDGGTNPTCHTCAELNADCGSVTDPACPGIVLDCGSQTCATSGEFCGCGGPSKCGVCTTTDGGLDGGNNCTASTCTELGAECGFVNDTKCPGTVVDCSGVKTCAQGEVCNLGKCTASDGGSCTPVTTSCPAAYECGAIADECSNAITCGTCATGKDCQDHLCVSNMCVPDPALNCTGRGWTCGSAADNCGNKYDCGPVDCGGKAGWSCGGGGVVGTCGCAPQANGMPGTCTKIPDCPTTGPTTSITGKVYDPAGNNPLYNVLVYVPNDPNDPNLKTFPQQISCDVCGASAAGGLLVSTFTGVDGSFTLKDVPAGTGIPVVIQLGRWRRQFTINIPTACGPNTITDKTLLMPSTQAQGNIPLMAMMTGNSDSLECVLRKMGIASTEFTNPAQNGRVQFYLGGGNSGQRIDTNTPGQATLFGGAGATLNKYDMAILACQGGAYAETKADQDTLRSYADKGGRVFMTHYSYTWATQSNPGSAQNNAATPTAAVGTADNWAYGDGVRPSDIADWHIDENDRPANAVGIIDTVTNPKATAFQGWLEAVGASTAGSGQITVNVIRHDTDLISSVAGQTQQWLYRNGGNARTCSIGGNSCTSIADCNKRCSVATQTACTTDANCSAMVCQNRTQQACTQNSDCTGARGPCVPNTCSATVNTCAGTDYTGTHIPLHFTFNTPVNLVEDLNATPPKVQCGRVLFSDFHVQDAAENGVTYPNQCGATCTVATQATDCGAGNKCAADGHCISPMTAQEKLLEFMIFDLGSCVPPKTVCTPKACPSGQCGFAPDGCGGLSACDPCPTGTACGVGQPAVPNQCGSITCNPLTSCTGQGPGGSTPSCGFISDTCSGVVGCGQCPTGQVCVNGGCTTGSCTPTTTCTSQNIACGSAADNCGNKLDCGMCPGGQTCSMGKCYPNGCIPNTSCAIQGLACGATTDNCGNKLDCGACNAGDFCQAGKCVPLN